MKTKRQINNIDIEPLAKILSEYLGYDIKLTKEVREGCHRNEPYLCIQSQELKQYAGINECLYESLKITNFGGSLTKDEKQYWMPINFDFQYFRGSNGRELCTVWYAFKTKTWEVQFENSDYKKS